MLIQVTMKTDGKKILIQTSNILLVHQNTSDDTTGITVSWGDMISTYQVKESQEELQQLERGLWANKANNLPDDVRDAVVRLRAWLRDYGDQKQLIFVKDLTTVLDRLVPGS